MEKDKNVQPFIKWVGGKRQLLSEINKYIPSDFDTYYEPFIGGGAVFLNNQPKRAIINDWNKELINAYQVIQSNVEELIDELKKHKNESEYFYSVREWDRLENYEERSLIEKAGRLIYLNKTCYNGLYRVNKSGYFNTPFGKYKNPAIVQEERLRALNKYFNTNDITFTTGDFKSSLKSIKSGDFVYFDPPYVPLNVTSNFTSYTQGGFNLEEQIRLRETCDELHDKGVRFLLSNSNTPFIQEQYQDYTIEIVNAKRSINSRALKRGAVEEVLIRNY